ncbi:hypothetical protein H4219_005312 [Mycoemilia scoparia]|uniref:Solute carrier family 25 member 38 homolog n=1 Tax=Mycoemilia scoparia TaxID=417184 RepID=A0A9W7ZUF2_9FUNG|nr:hypothetical protein H4219_005312 [Mycoemilia scoparia]
MNRIRLVLAKVEGTNSGGLRCSDGTAQRAITEIPKLSAGSTMVTGSLARASAGFVLMPATVLKVRYESNLYKYGSLWNAVGNILKTDGIKGFFSGAVPTAIRDAPYAGIYLFLYERIKTFERDTMSKRNIIIPEALVTLSSGMVSGITASYITQPFDMVKTRIQIQPNLYSGMFNSFVRIFKEEGIQGFFRGISLRVLRKGIQAGISFTLYEWVLRSQAKK